jgi:hypothetical protein
MTLPFDPKRSRAYEIEFGAGGQRLGSKFMLEDGSTFVISESEIDSEVEAHREPGTGDGKTTNLRRSHLPASSSVNF